MMFEVNRFYLVVRSLDELTSKLAENGEKIKCILKSGEVFDMGEKTLFIEKGVFFEVYDYNELKVYFVRVYIYKGDDRSWASLYIDENPETPWWSKKERLR